MGSQSRLKTIKISLVTCLTLSKPGGIVGVYMLKSKFNIIEFHICVVDMRTHCSKMHVYCLL